MESPVVAASLMACVGQSGPSPITRLQLRLRPSPAIQSVIALRHFYCSSILVQYDFQLICLSGGRSPHLAAAVSDVQHTDCELHHHQTEAYH